MTVREIGFVPEKAVESVLYMASRLGSPTVHEVLKIRYFADKIHLANYGFIASGDDYVAMKFGPVASTTYDLLKAARGDQSGWIHPRLYQAIDGALTVDRISNKVVAQRGPDLSRLSKSDIECLDEAMAKYGNMGFLERTELSHDTAWKAAWETAAEDEVGQSPMSLAAIAGALTNANEVIAHLTA